MGKKPLWMMETFSGLTCYNKGHIMRETIRIQDETIRKKQETIEQQRVAIEVGTTTIAMLKRQGQAEVGINKRLRKELKRTGQFLSELGR